MIDSSMSSLLIIACVYFVSACLWCYFDGPPEMQPEQKQQQCGYCN